MYNDAPLLDAAVNTRAFGMRWRKPLLTTHISASVAVLGGDLALLALGLAGARGADPLSVYPAALLLGTWIVAPLAIVALVTGILLGTLTPWGLFRHRWVTLKLAVTFGLTVLVLLVLLPALGRAAGASSMLAPEMLPDAMRTRLAIAPAAASALLAMNIALAVYKPRLRRREQIATSTRR
jgi:hypothetical protein